MIVPRRLIAIAIAIACTGAGSGDREQSVKGASNDHSALAGDSTRSVREGEAALAGATVVLLASAAADTRIQDDRFSSPEKTLVVYFSALGIGDKVSVAACFDPPATDFYLPAPLVVDKWVVKKRIVYGRRELDRWNSKGIVPPAVEGDVELQVEQDMSGKKSMFYYNLRLVPSGWKIVAHSGSGWPD